MVFFDAAAAIEGVTLLNGCDGFPDLEGLRRDFDVIYFLDLCAGIESAILYDKLYLTAMCSGAEPILEPLNEAGVLYDARITTIGTATTLEQIMGRPRAAQLMKRVKSKNYLEDVDLDLGIKAIATATSLLTDLAIEEDTGFVLSLPFQQVPVYASIPAIEYEREAIYEAKLDLAARYSDLTATLFAFRDHVAVHDLDRLPLPPIALETITRATTFDELGSVIVDQRDRYRHLRNRFRLVREVYASPDYSYHERYEEKAKLDADMKRISESVRDVPTMLGLCGDVEKLAEAVIPAASAHDYTKLTKLLGPFAKFVDDKAFRFRVRPVTGLTQAYLGQSLRDIAAATKVLFGHELTATDARRALTYAAAVKKYVPERKAAAET